MTRRSLIAYHCYLHSSPHAANQGDRHTLSQLRSVTKKTTCFVDIDLGQHDRESALNTLLQADPAPSAIVDTGGGYHAYWLLEAPETDFRLWRAVQRSLVRRFAAIGADPVPSTDLARILRLTPFPNRKYREPRPTAIARESEQRYDLATLARAFAAGDAESLPDIGADELAEAEIEPSPYGLYADRQLNARRAAGHGRRDRGHAARAERFRADAHEAGCPLRHHPGL